MIFRDRDQAARLLAEKLRRTLKHAPGQRPVVLGIPRGGVPIAKVVADAMGGVLDVVLVHKLSSTRDPEFAIGAVSESGDVYLTHRAHAEGATEDELASAAEKEISKLERKRKLYTPHHKSTQLQGRDVILADDGIATGSTMLAAVRSVMESGAARVIVATPVASNDAILRLEREGAEICVLSVPEHFYSVSQFYTDFQQVSDEEVVAALAGRPPEVLIDSNGLKLKAFLRVPTGSRGLILFVHGSGSGRLSPRNQIVAESLYSHGYATLLVDLLNESELRGQGFDCRKISRRVVEIIDWVEQDPQLSRLPMGLFGASTGAAAAITASVAKKERIRAIVCRGGRVDLSMESLPLVTAAVLFIVGANDEPVLSLNREAFAQLNSEKELKVIDGAGHLFEEPGALNEVASQTVEWFDTYLHPKSQDEIVSYDLLFQ